MSARFRWTLTNLGDSSSDLLTKDPIGWEEMTLRLSRDQLYHGVFTEFTLSLKWHCNGGGKEFIDNVYSTEDINGNIQVLIEIDCDSSGTYTELYTGKLNLASYMTDGEFTTCNIEKSDLFSKLKARDEISVDLESDTSIGGDAITVVGSKQLPMHSQNIFLKSKMESLADFSSSVTLEVANSVAIKGFVSHQLTITQDEADNFIGWNDYSDIALNGPGSSETLIPEIFEAIDENVQYPAVYTFRAHLTGTFTDTVVSLVNRTNSAHTLVLRYGNDFDGFNGQVVLYGSGGYSSGALVYTEPFDTSPLTDTISLNYGDKVWLYWFENEEITTGPYLDDIVYEWEYTRAEFSLEINSTTEASEAKTFLIHEAFNQVADSIADVDFRFYSDFYGRVDSDKIRYAEDGCGSHIAITNGMNIREFADKSIFCSLKDLFTVANAIHNVGLTIEEVNTIYAGSFEAIRVEKLSFFYDGTTEVLNLTGGVKVERVNDNTRYINKADFGYEKWETEFNGGLDEPCTRHEYSTAVNSTKGTYSKLSKYIASGYAIELTRRKDIEETTDWRYDNDNFLIAVNNFFKGQIQFVVASAIYVDLPLSAVSAGDVLEITGTASNDGTYTVDSVSENVDGGITIFVNEAVVNETAFFATLVNVYNQIYTPEKADDAFNALGGSGMVSLLTAYNIRLTPARMLLAHIGVITACLQVILGFIRFIKGEGNTTLAIEKNDVGCQEDFSGVELAEDADFNWNEPDAANAVPLWQPEIYKFEYPLTAAQLATLRANPHGYISVLDDHGNTLTGFILDAEYRLKTGVTKFELLKRFAV